MTAPHVAQFAALVQAHCAARGSAAPRWARDHARASGHPTCAYCQADLDMTKRGSWGLSPLVPYAMGGPGSSENRALACTACIRQRRSRDLLAWTELAARAQSAHLNGLRQRHLDVLRHSENHLTRAGLHASTSTVLQHLAQRWARPRWVAFVLPHAGGAVIGWEASQAHEGAAEAGAWLRHAYAGAVLAVKGPVAFDVPGKFFQAAVWHLIEAHALAVDLSEPGYADDVPRRWEDCWRARYTSLQSLQKRRETAQEIPWPTLPPVRSASTRAVQSRAKRAEAQGLEAKARWLEARARLRQRDAEMAVGLGLSYLPGEREALQTDVDGLGLRWSRLAAVPRNPGTGPS